MRALRCLGVLGLAFLAACPSSPHRPRGVLLIVLDTLRADRCSVIDYERPTTPALEAFARDAVVFTDAWSPASWTGPAHASLFTGLRPDRHGFVEGSRDFLESRETTLAERLSAAGWGTACFSANTVVAAEFGLTQGFAKEVPLHRNPLLATADEVHRVAFEWMVARRAEGRPFFAYVNDMEAHGPYRPPRRLQERFLRPGLGDDAVESARALSFPRIAHLQLGCETAAPGELEAVSDLYDADVVSVDEQVGALLGRLRAEGMLDDMIVVVMSDHGEGLGDHGWIDHAVLLYRELLRVPLIVRAPGVLDGGRRVDGVVRVEDVMPTILELCGFRVPADLDGVSLLDERAERVAFAMSGPNERLASAFHESCAEADVGTIRRRRHSVYDGRHHLVADDKGGLELFDVRADPRELHNLAVAQPGLVQSLLALLEGALAR